MTVRVVHCGTGLTGREALRAIIEDPALELVGQYVSTAAKHGVDAGELCGLPSTGVTATSSLDEVVALGADCLCYAGSTVGRELEAATEIAQFLRAGTNVVTFALVAMCYPPTSPPELKAVIDAACAAGGTSIYASGTEPGAMSLNVPAALLTMGGVITGYRMEIHAMDLATSYPVEEVLRESMGFGKPDGFAPPRIAGGDVQRHWRPVVHFVADLIGAELDDLRVDWDTACTPVDLDTPIGTIPARTICAYRWQLSGVVDGRKVVSVEYIANITRDAFMPEAWPRLPSGMRGGLVYVIEGRPAYRGVLSVDPMPGERLNGSIPMTALAATNAIPAVVAAPPGHLGPTDLPHYTTRRVGGGAD
jgi:hypothetical protein